MDIPIWVYAVVAGIVISAIMALKTGREERQLELEMIEKEGKVYMERLEQQRKEREGEELSMDEEQQTNRQEEQKATGV